MHFYAYYSKGKTTLQHTLIYKLDEIFQTLNCILYVIYLLHFLLNMVKEYCTDIYGKLKFSKILY